MKTLLLVSLLLPATAPSLVTTSTECPVVQLSGGEQQQISAAIVRHAPSGGATTSKPETMERGALLLGTVCHQVAVLSWDGGHSGGVAVFTIQQRSGLRIKFADWYRGASRLAVLPRGSILFVWRSGWGSGFLEEQAVVLQPLADSWQRTHYFLATLVAAPPQRNATQIDEPHSVHTTYLAQGDTLLIARVDSVGEAPSATLRVHRTVSRFVLP